MVKSTLQIALNFMINWWTDLNFLCDSFQVLRAASKFTTTSEPKRLYCRRCCCCSFFIGNQRTSFINQFIDETFFNFFCFVACGLLYHSNFGSDWDAIFHGATHFPWREILMLSLEIQHCIKFEFTFQRDKRRTHEHQLDFVAFDGAFLYLFDVYALCRVHVHFLPNKFFSQNIFRQFLSAL